MNFANKRVTVIGLSESGFSAAKLLKKLNAKVRISELCDDDDVKTKLALLEDIEFEIRTHTRRFISKSDLIVTSPGVPPDAEPLQWARDENISVIGELELGYMFCAAPIVAVTGTNGKSTVVSLMHEIFKASGINSFLLGNIGKPICEDILEIPPQSVIVLEVSSFQLEAIKTFRPKIAVFLNLTQDHLDRYRDMKEYRSAKLRIFENQKDSDYAILDYDDPAIRGLSQDIKSTVFYFSANQKVRGSYIDRDRLLIDLGDGAEEICRREDISLSGIHNLKNVLAAALAAKLINRRANIVTAVKNFVGLKHRFELVAEIEGVSFIDDSKSTTVDSTMKALEFFSEGNVVLIAGGRDKGSDYSPLAGQIKKIKHLVLIGEARKKIREAVGGFNLPVEEAATVQDAISFSRKIAKEGDTVLLSPMCSSFDMFKDYKQRGEVFREAVFSNTLCKA